MSDAGPSRFLRAGNAFPEAGAGTAPATSAGSRLAPRGGRPRFGSTWSAYLQPGNGQMGFLAACSGGHTVSWRPFWTCSASITALRWLV